MKKLNAAGRGEKDYDFGEDTLFLKIKDRNYETSIEIENFVLDLDKEGFIMGIQIFGASNLLGVSKQQLKNLKDWQLEAKIEENRLFFNLKFQIKEENKIVEKNPIIFEQMKESFADSQVVCSVA
ncbi:DUF2283 domain-containing protein [Candidatus Woesearchaeota archaeon]|nr:DUF2283 domain-containing protein [Candidatus Woesearchaeota archaeon]